MINEAGKIPILGFSFFICLHSGHEQKANEAHTLKKGGTPRGLGISN